MDDESKEILKDIALSIKSQRKILGFKIQEIAIILTLFVTLLGFYIRTNDAMQHLIKVTDYLVIFVKNSDGYHSTITGIQFENGKPMNADSISIRRKI